MQIQPKNPSLSVRSSVPDIGHISSCMTNSGVALLSNDGTIERTLNTAEDVRACGNTYVRQGIARNQGIIDMRCKAIRGRLNAKVVQRRNTQRQIAKLDTLMQKLLETQDPDNEKMYDLYAKRKAMLETKL